MKFRDVYIEKESFKTLIASAIEVYSKETNGVLLGWSATREIDGVKRRVVSIKDVYPIQTEERKRSEVTHGNIAAFDRFLSVMKSLRTDMVGGFHSHPYPYEGTFLSRGDIDFIRDEVKIMSKKGQKRVEKGWLEILISVKKREYKSTTRSRWYTSCYIKKVRCRIRTQKKVGYDVVVSAYWVYPKGMEKDKIKYGVKEVVVYVPWIEE
jgi:proteasome lid subunit RPN8/RPN11